MEKEYSQYSFDEVFSLYGDRVVEQDSPAEQKKLDIQDREGLTQKIEAVAGRAYKEGEVVETVETVDDSIPLTLAVLKSNNYWAVRLLIDTPPDQFDFNAFDEEKTVANIDWYGEGGVFFSEHRYVLPEYRRENGLGVMLLKASEAFAKKCVNGNRETNLMKQNIAQLDVMMWLLKNGYEPDTENDRRNLDMVLSGSEELCIGERNYIFPVDVPEEDRVDLNEEKSNKALRIRLVKKIEPSLSEDAKEVRAGVEDAVENVAKL